MTNGNDPLYEQAVAVVIRDQKATTSYLQRILKLGYNRAAQLMESMESAGVVSAADHVGKRTVLLNSPEDVAKHKKICIAAGVPDAPEGTMATVTVSIGGKEIRSGAARKGHNQKRVGGVAVDQLKSIIARVEKLEEEKAGIGADIKDVFAEAKGNGFDVKTIRQIIKMRKKDAQEIEEEETILDTYLRALGMRPQLELDFDDEEEGEEN